MVLSLLRIAAVGALASTAVACTTTVNGYVEKKGYDHTNFLDGFRFNSDPDLSHGFVSYQTKAAAISAGLYKITADNKVHLAADNTPVSGASGRKSVRVEGNYNFTYGLVIADFAHLPAPKCGLWPAFWMYAEPWPHYGEFDMYESFNLAKTNTITMHTYNASVVGNCKLVAGGMTGTVDSNKICDNTYRSEPLQYSGQGCSVDEDTAGAKANPFGLSTGGLYAMEWTDTYIKTWSWIHGHAPDDIHFAHPNPKTWGTPRSYVGLPNCNIANVIKNQHLTINLDFCGDAAGNNFGACSALTGQTCNNYVKNNGHAFDNAYFDINSIKIFQKGPVVVNTACTTTTTKKTTTTAKAATTTKKTTTTTKKTTTTAKATTTKKTTTTAKATTTKKTTTTAKATVKALRSDPTASSAASFDAEESCSDELSTSTSVSDCSESSMSTSASGYTTSTIYDTTTSTIYSCAPTVTNCPYGRVTTIIVAVSTTVCPISEYEKTHTGATTTPTTTATSTTSTTSTTSPTSTTSTTAETTSATATGGPSGASSSVTESAAPTTITTSTTATETLSTSSVESPSTTPSSVIVVISSVEAVSSSVSLSVSPSVSSAPATTTTPPPVPPPVTAGASVARSSLWVLAIAGGLGALLM